MVGEEEGEEEEDANVVVSNTDTNEFSNNSTYLLKEERGRGEGQRREGKTCKHKVTNQIKPNPNQTQTKPSPYFSFPPPFFQQSISGSTNACLLK